jgi:hypothetical protein
MEIKKLLFRKEMKLVTLLLTSLLIASASAAVYYSMVMQSSVSTSAADVAFVAGNDSTTAGATGYTTDGTWVNLASLKAYPNVTLTYDQAINISCTGSNHQFKLTHSSITNGTAAISNFYSITFKLIAPNGTQYGGDFTYSNTNGDNNWSAAPTMNYIWILAGEEWAVKVVTRAKSGATASQVCAVVINVDVK